jgi:hypothetical protein
MLVQVGGCWCGASAQEDLFSEGSSRELDGNHDASTPLQESRTPGDLPLRRRRLARRSDDRVARVTGSLDSLINDGWISPPEDDSGVRNCTGPDGSDVSYPESALDVLGLDGGHGFWFYHRFEAVLDLLKREGVACLWDIGAGTGSMATRLSQAGIDVVAVEPFKAGAEASARPGVTSFCGTLQDVRLPDACLPAIGLFDVLEHLEHPEELLKEAHRVLQPDGILLVTVPALRWLWGGRRRRRGALPPLQETKPG